MGNCKGYVWYSAGSDPSGPALAKALGFEAGKKTPNFTLFDVVIGFGCKAGTGYNKAIVDKQLAECSLRILNGVEAVEDNRNKMFTLSTLAESGVRVPSHLMREMYVDQQKFIDAVLEAMGHGTLQHPVMGMDKYNKGAPNFCYTPEDVVNLVSSGATLDYFRAYVPGEEYRIHVFRDMILVAQKKVLVADPIATTATNLCEKAIKVEQKAGRALTAPKEELERMARIFAVEMLRAPSHVLKSVSRGWEFQDEDVNTVPDAILAIAVKAVEAARLDFGAVSITRSPAGPVVTNIASAFMLMEQHLVPYIAAITEFVEAGKMLAPKKVVAIPAPTEQEVRANIATTLANLPIEKVKHLGEMLAKL